MLRGERGEGTRCQTTAPAVRDCDCRSAPGQIYNTGVQKAVRQSNDWLGAQGVGAHTQDTNGLVSVCVAMRPCSLPAPALPQHLMCGRGSTPPRQHVRRRAHRQAHKSRSRRAGATGAQHKIRAAAATAPVPNGAQPDPYRTPALRRHRTGRVGSRSPAMRAY